VRLIELLLERSALPKGGIVLDVGCGIGGTARYLASQHCSKVIGLTISGRQVEMAHKLSIDAAGHGQSSVEGGEFIRIGDGAVRFVELDVEKMGGFFQREPNALKFDCVWVSEALSHFPDKRLFFADAAKLLKPNGKLVVADWFKAENLSDVETKEDIIPIEDGMLLPPLCTQTDYVKFSEQAGLQVFSEPLNISKQVSKTWDISWSLVQSPSLWNLAISQGRDFLAFLQAFRAMRRGFATGSFQYAVIVFQKR